ncbi:MAG: CHASE3 domain-containing protein, partial [Cyanobacteria bacterium]|nr:CHASE3 domain-containing protein [Cyanobacteriota bacterium]
MKLEKQQTRIYLIIAAVIAFLILIVAGYLTSQQILNLSAHRRSIMEMHGVLTSLEQLEVSISQAESANRAFLLTGRKDFKKPYEVQKKRIWALVDSVQWALTSNSTQSEMFEELRQRIEEKLQDLEKISNERAKTDSKTVRELVLADLEQPEKDGISVLLNRIEASEESVISEQAGMLESGQADSIQLILGLCATSLSVFLTTFIYVDAAEVARLQRHGRQQLFFRISQALAEPLPLAECVNNAIKLFCLHFNWTFGSFWVPDGQYHIRCYDFFGEEKSSKVEEVTRALVLQKGEGLAGAAWWKEAPIFVRIPATSDGTARGQAFVAEKVRAGFAFPVLLGTELVGVFEFFSRRREPMDDASLNDFAVAGADIAQFVRRKDTEDRLAKSLQELESSKGVLESVLKNMGSGVVVADSTGQFLTFNDSARAILGQGPIDLAADGWSKAYGVYVGEDNQLVEHDELPLVKALRGESSDNVILFCKNESRPNGVWIMVNGRPIFNSQGDIIAGVIVIEDISLRREAEKRVSEFYSTVSHELRTPLTSIRGALGLIEGGKAGDLSARAQHLISIANNECDRLIRLINDILDIRKIEAGKVELHLESLSPNALVLESVESMRSFASQHSIKLEASLTCDDAIWCDHDRLIQILTNLISNAVKYSQPDTDVVAATLPGPGVVRFEVRDSGPGIAERDQRKLFRYFQQLDSSDTRQKGGS